MEEKLFLLVDDDYDDAELFGEALSELKTHVKFRHVDESKNLFQFLQNEDEKKPDLLFLDINMPPVSGWESLTELKKHPEYKNIPVVMYSTSSSVRDNETAMTSGAIGLLSKPSEFKLLVEMLGTIAEAEQQDLETVITRYRNFDHR
jgi:CheY-like chemotaxis protein